MGLLQPLPCQIIPVQDPPAIPNNQDLPRDEMDIFFRNIQAFIPEGKTWEQCTPEEKKKAQDQYRFDPMRPGCPQGISGIGGMAG